MVAYRSTMIGESKVPPVQGNSNVPPSRDRIFSAGSICLASTLLTFHGASFILHAHKNLEPDSEDIEKIIIELPSKL